MAKLNLATTDDNEETVKRKRNFEVADAHALYAVYPQFFKLVPDYAKIRQAMKLGLGLPGVTMVGHETISSEDSHIEENHSQPLKRL